MAAVSTIGQRRSAPCTWRELQRNAANGPKGIPIGGVFFWTKSFTGLPNGCVIMDCKANSVANGGSGINMIDAYFKCKSPSFVGPDDCTQHPQTPLGLAGGHTHELTIYNKTLDVTVLVADAAADLTLLEAGRHFHEIFPQYLDVDESFGLDKTFNTYEVDLTISPHDCGSIANCVRPHPPHSHGLQGQRNDLDQQGLDSAISGFRQCTDDIPGPVMDIGCTIAITLNHDSSSADDVMHEFTWSTGIFATKPTRHFHPFFVDVNHRHTFKHGPVHDHTGVTVLIDHHNHLLLDDGHRHTAIPIVVRHSHGHEITEEPHHTHDPGEPKHLHLVPVERIF